MKKFLSHHLHRKSSPHDRRPFDGTGNDRRDVAGSTPACGSSTATSAVCWKTCSPSGGRSGRLGPPGAATANYLPTNPGPGTPVVQDIPNATVAFESLSRHKRLSSRGEPASRRQLVADLVAVGGRGLTGSFGGVLP